MNTEGGERGTFDNFAQVTYLDMIPGIENIPTDFLNSICF